MHGRTRQATVVLTAGSNEAAGVVSNFAFDELVVAGERWSHSATIAEPRASASLQVGKDERNGPFRQWRTGLHGTRVIRRLGRQHVAWVRQNGA